MNLAISLYRDRSHCTWITLRSNTGTLPSRPVAELEEIHKTNHKSVSLAMHLY